MKKQIEKKSDEQPKKEELENQHVVSGEEMRKMTAKEKGSIYTKMMLENLNTNSGKIQKEKE